MSETAMITRKPFLVPCLKYFEVARINFTNCLTYPANMLSRSVLVCFRLWIMCQLYEASFSSLGIERIGGLTLSGVVWCLMFTQCLQSSCWVRPLLPFIIDEEVKSGTLAYSLNRPCSYVLFNYFGYLGRSLPNLLLNLFVASLATCLLIGPQTFELSAYGPALLLAFLGFTLHFFISFAIGMLALWIEDTSAFSWLYHKGQLVLGGLVVPLSVFPDQLRNVMELMPFAQLFYAPARILVQFESELFLRFLFSQILWIALFGALAQTLFRLGSRNVAINGG
jgi:ABC-2 type transport system permease protein